MPFRGAFGSPRSFQQTEAPVRGDGVAPEAEPGTPPVAPRAETLPGGVPSASVSATSRRAPFPSETAGNAAVPQDDLPTVSSPAPRPSGGVPGALEGAAGGTLRRAPEEITAPRSSSAAPAASEEVLLPLRERTPRDRREGSEGESRRQSSSFSGDPAALAAGNVAPARSTFGDVLAAQSLSARGDAAILEGAELLLRAAVRAESQTARMIIDPPALGPMEVSVTLAGDGLSASFRVESETVRQLLLQNADALRESLARAGISVGGFSVSVDVGQGGGHFAESSPETRRRARDRQNDDEGEERGEPLGRLDAEAGVLHWVG